MSAASAAETGGADAGGEGGKKRGWAAIDDDDTGEFAVGGWRIAQVSDVYMFTLYFSYYTGVCMCALHWVLHVRRFRGIIPGYHTCVWLVALNACSIFAAGNGGGKKKEGR